MSVFGHKCVCVCALYGYLCVSCPLYHISMLNSSAPLHNSIIPVIRQHTSSPLTGPQIHTHAHTHFPPRTGKGMAYIAHVCVCACVLENENVHGYASYEITADLKFTLAHQSTYPRRNKHTTHTHTHTRDREKSMEQPY